MSNEVFCGNGKSRLDARTYRAIRMTEFNKTAEKSSYNISQDSSNDLHAEGSRKSDNGRVSCEPSCKRQRVDSTIQNELGSSEGVVAPSQQIFSQSKSPQMNGSPVSKEEGDEGENDDAKEEGEIVGAEENGIDASHDQSPLVSQDSPNAYPEGLNDLKFREYWVPVQLSNVQLEQYCSTLITNSWSLCSSAKKGILNHLNDVLRALRKCCDHPYALDPSLVSFSKEHSPSMDYLSIGIKASGKLQLLSKLLPQIREQGLRVLIVYKTINNPVKNAIGIGHILDDFICQSFGQESYVHIYSHLSVPQREKQTAVDLFNDKTKGKFVVLTEYKSSLVSIRLTSVDVVILFNSDWNPVNDIRALQKMTIHTESDRIRVFRQKMTIHTESDRIRVFRLYSVCTQEEKALGLSRDTVKSANPLVSRSTCHMLLAWGAANLFDKLDALHAINTSESTQSLESEFLCNIIHELSTILSSKADEPSICSLISKVSEVGRGYSGNIKLHGELEVQSLDDVPPNVFWSSLLDDRSPRWRFLPDESESMGRRIPLCERLPEMSEGGLLETGVLDKEIPRWSRGRSNAKRSLRGRRSTWKRLEESLRERGQMVLMKHSSSKFAGKSVSHSSNGLTSSLFSKSDAVCSDSVNCMAHGIEANLSPESTGLSTVQGDISELIQKVEETHQARMRELAQKQHRKILEYFRAKNEIRETMNKAYGLQKDLICELGESLSKLDKLKELDDQFKIKLQGHDQEMDQCFANLKAAHWTERTNEEEMRLKRIESLKKSAASTLPGDSDGAKVSAPSTFPTVASIPVVPLQEPSPRERLKMVTANGLDVIDISPDSSPMEDSMAMPVDLDKFPEQVLFAEANDGVGQLDVEDIEVSLSRWTFEKVILSDQNQVSQGFLSSSVPITESQSFKESGQCTSNRVVPHSDFEISHESLPTEEMNVAMGSDIEQLNVTSVPVPDDQPAFPVSSSIEQMDVLSAPSEEMTVAMGSAPIEQINVTSVPVPVDQPAFLVSSSIEQMDVLSAPNTPDNLNISDCSPVPESELGANILKKNQNHAPQNAISCSSPTTESQGPKYGMPSSDESALPSDTIGFFHDGLCTETPNMYVDSDDAQIHEISASTPVDKLQVTNNLSEEVPVNILKKNQNHAPHNAISCSSPTTESQGPKSGMPSSDESAVPSDTIGFFHDGLCTETPDMYVDSDDAQIHEISASTPVDKLQVTNNLSEEVPFTSSEELNPLSAASLSSMGNQHKEAQRMSDGVSTGGSSPFISLPDGEHGSVNQDTTVEDLRQQTQANAPTDLCSSVFISSTMPQLNCTNQSCQLPLDQLPTTQPLCTEMRVTDGSSSLPSSQYVGNGACSQPVQTSTSGSSFLLSSQYVVNGACSQLLQSSTRASLPGPNMCGLFDASSVQTNNHLMLHQIAAWTEENTLPHLSDPTRNYYLNNSRSSDVRTNSHQPARLSLDPLQIELERIQKANDEAMKKCGAMVAQLKAAHEQEIAQISQKYALLFQAANNDYRQKKEELNVYYEKTKAHKSLAEAWTLAFDDDSPIDKMFLPSCPGQSTGLTLANGMQLSTSVLPGQFPYRLPITGLPLANGMQTGVSALPHQFPIRFSTDQFIRPPNPPLSHSFYNSEGGWGPNVQNPYLHSSLPAASIPFDRFPLPQLNQHTLNAASYSQLYNFGDYQVPHNVPI